MFSFYFEIIKQQNPFKDILVFHKIDRATEIYKNRERGVGGGAGGQSIEEEHKGVIKHFLSLRSAFACTINYLMTKNK